MPADGPLHRPYLLGELQAMRRATEIDGSIVVQAAPTRAESEFLLGLAAQDPCILGVVGWVELDRQESVVEADLEELLGLGPLVAIRPMIQDIEDPAWLSRPNVQHSLRLLARRGLVFELLCREHQLPPITRVLARHEELRVCVDHLAKPDYTGCSSRWLMGIRALGELPQAYCKVSGLVTEVASPASSERFRRHVEAAAEAFGAARLMYGSDWPVCRLAAEPVEVRDLVDELTAHFTGDERDRFWGQAAAGCYRLTRSSDAPPGARGVARSAARAADPAAPIPSDESAADTMTEDATTERRVRELERIVAAPAFGC